MSDERKDDDEGSPPVYSIGSDKDLVGVSSRAAYFKRRRTRSVIILILACFIATLLVAVVVLAVLYSRLHRANAICDNEDCVRIAASLKESMDTSVDPCDDFYGHVCGRWPEEHHSPKSEDSWFNDRNDRNIWRVQELLKKNFTNTDVPWAVQQAKSLYESCNDVESIELLGLKPLLSGLKRVDLPRIPAGLTGEHGDLVKIMAKVRRLFGADVFFGIEIGPDPRNKTRNIVTLDVPSFTSPLLSYNTELERRMKTVKSRTSKLDDEPDDDDDSKISWAVERDYMMAVIRQIITNETASNGSCIDEESDPREREIKKMAHKIYEISSDVYWKAQSEMNETIDDENVSDVDYMLVNEIQEKTDRHVREVNSSLTTREIWRPFMEELFIGVEGLNLDKDLVLVTNLEYLKTVALMLATYDDLELESSVWWSVVEMMVPYSSKQLTTLWLQYMKSLVAYESSPKRSLYCADVAGWMMGMAVSWLYADPEFHEKKGTRVIEMLEDIRTAFSTIVVETDWMDRDTQRATLDKARKMTYVIGHPSWLFEKGMLDDYYEGVDMKDDEYMDNLLTMTRLMVEEELNQIQEHNTLNGSFWAADPIEVNALHSFVINHITVPEGILQFPFYGLGLEALNYGAIGAILGHELTHGFDNNGRLYDVDGNVRQWWSNTTIQRFNEKIRCFVKHYDSYYVDEVDDYIDGELTLDENIADNGGLREAVLAYKKWKNRNGREPMLPGFTHLSHEQLLFLSFAHLWCERNSAESLQWKLRDTHCPGHIRLRGVLRNSPEFSEAWNCPLGSPMNPEKKCKVW